MKKQSTTIKLQDTSGIIGANSRLEDYWQKKGFENFYTKFRKGVKLPREYQTIDSVEKLIKSFKLNAVGFGNWVTQEDRFNYISALTIALYDMGKVLNFKQNIGLFGLVSFSFGARGSGGALAHFEPHTFIINVTRYADYDQPKEFRFVYTGGAGSVAHEYGHALDYYFGLFKEVDSQVGALSGGRTTKTKYLEHRSTPMRKAINDLIDEIIWKEKYKTKSAYYLRLEANFDGDYMFRRNEIFARAFEKFIQYELYKMGIVNKFLHETKYDPRAYLSDGEMIKLLPLFIKLIALMAAKV